MKKTLAYILCACLIFALVPAFVQAETATQAVEITIFHTNDVHSRVLPNPGMGYALAAGYVDAARAAGDNVLLLDAGDTFHGMAFSTIVQGESIVDIMNAMKYDAIAPGNHDFNYGVPRLIELSAMLKVPVISANLTYKDGKQVLQPYTIIEVGGKRIGVIGVETPEMAGSITPKYSENIMFTPGVEAVTDAVNEIIDSTDAIVVLAHWGTSGVAVTSEVLAKIPGVDLVIDGHAHDAFAEGKAIEGGALIVSTGCYIQNLGKVQMTIGADGAVAVAAELIPAPTTFPANTVYALIAKIAYDEAPILDQVVAKSSFDLDGERATNRSQQTNLGSLLCDAMMFEVNADCAIMNGGGIRASIPVGEITKGQVLTVLPFANYLVAKEVKGADIKAGLEVGLRLYPDLNGGFPQVGGMSVTFDPSLPEGSRIVDMTIGGETLNDEKMYLVASNDYLASGGDGYVSFANYPKAIEGGTLDDLLIKYLIAHPNVAPAADGRIIVVGP